MVDPTPLKPRSDSVRREQFLQHCAQEFDEYLAEHRVEPEFMVFVTGRLRGTTQTGWLVQGDAEDAPVSCVALALLALQRAAHEVGND